MGVLQDARIAKLPKWVQDEIRTRDQRIKHLESAIKNYEGVGESRVSYHYGIGTKKDDRYLPEHSQIEWVLRDGQIIRIHERPTGNLAINTDGQLTILPHSANWIEIPLEIPQ